MTQTRLKWFNSGIEPWAAAHVPSVFGAATPLELQNSNPPDIALGGKKDTNRSDKTKYPKHAGATSATQFCNNRAPNSASENALGGCTAILGKYVAGAG